VKTWGKRRQRACTQARRLKFALPLTGTPIPRYQASAVRAWARLLGIPYLLAVNS